MLQINALHLKRFCQFDSLDLELSAGLTRIAGPNGSGKTTVFRALIYGLTGWCDPSWGTQSELQKDDESVPGYVTLDLLINGELYKLTRYTLVTAKTPDCITKDSKLVVEKRQRVNAWLEQYVDVPLTVLAQLVWLRQEQSSWLLTATASSINSFLGIIFDTKKLDKLRDGVKKSLDKIATIQDDYESIKSKNEEFIPSLEAELAAAEENKIKQEVELEKLTELVAVAAVSKTQQEIDSSKSELNQQFEVLLEKANALNIESCKCDVVLAHELEEKKQTYEDFCKVYSKAEHDFKAKKFEYDLYYSKLEDIKEEPAHTCKLCGAVIKDTKEYLKSQYIEAMSSIGVYCEAADALFDNVRDLALNTLDTRKQQLETLSVKLEELDTEGAKLKAELQKLELAYKEYLSYLEKKLQYDSICNKIAEINEKLLELDSIPVRPEGKTEAQLLNEKKVVTAYLSETDKQIRVLTRQIDLCNLQLEQAAKNHIQSDINKKARYMLIVLRESLSQSRAQARYINCKIDMLNQYINSFLTMTEMPFVLELNKEEHLFKYHMQDSDVWHPAGMLSGAQKAAASIAIQMALLKVAVNDVTLLLIDEADASLDLSNKFIAARLYKDVSMSFASVEGSVLIISQSEEITNICDKEIDVCLR